MKFKKIVVTLVVLAILAVSVIVMVVLIETKPVSVKNPNRRSIVGVKTMPAELGDYSVNMTYPGRVAARQILTLSSEVVGKVMEADVPLKTGQKFKKGDVIVNIFDDDVRATHAAQISSFLNTLSTSLPDIKVDFPNEYSKWHTFFSKIEIDKKLPKLPSFASDKEKIYISSKNILTAYYNLIQREIVLDRYQIRAPFDGIYTSVTKEVGSIVSTNGEIASITSTAQLELVVGVSLADAQNLSVGTVVDVVSSKNKVYKGKIDRISAYVERSTQRVNVYVLFNEPGMEIVEGEMLSLTLPSMTLKDVQEVYREATIGDSIIFAVENNVLVAKPIEVVVTTPDKTYFTGVVAGDTIVNESLVSPYAGMEVSKLNMNGEPVK